MPAKSYTWNVQKIKAVLNQHMLPSHTEYPNPEDLRNSAANAYRLVTAEEVELVHNVGRLEQLLASDATLRGDTEGVVAVDCEGVPDTLCLLQLATQERVLVLDGIKL